MTKKSGKTKNLYRDVSIMVGVLALVAVIYVLFFDSPDVVSPGPHSHSSSGPATGSMGTQLELPEGYDALVALGNETMDQGRYAEAAECYRRALELDGNSTDVRTDFGACLHAMGLPERAIEEFRLVLNGQPNHRIANFNTGIVMRELGQLDSAKFYWERTLALDPEGPMAPRVKELLQGLDGSY